MAEEVETKRYENSQDNLRRTGGHGEESPRKRGDRPRRGRNRNKWISPSERYSCPLCKQNIRDMLTAIAVTEAKIPVHFSCVIKDIAVSEVLHYRERIVYLGKGEFGIVKFRGGNSKKFVIRKKIPYEQVEGDIPWRKEISRDLRG